MRKLKELLPKIAVKKVSICMSAILMAISFQTPARAIDWDSNDSRPWGKAPKGLEVGPDAHYMALGSTGIRAKYISGSKDTMLVMYVFSGSPADGIIEVGDVIIGVDGQDFQTSMVRGETGGYEGPFMEFGEALEKAQDSDGVIPVTVLRQSQTLDYDLTIPVTGTFSDTWPYDCPKSDALYPKLIALIASRANSSGNWNYVGIDGAMTCALAIMSSKDPQYFALQTTIAHRYADATVGSPNWDDSGPFIGWSYPYAAWYLSEYYLRYKDDPTKDVAWVVNELKEIRDMISEARVDYNSSWELDSGWGHRHEKDMSGYGPIGICTVNNLLALSIIGRCGITIDRSVFDEPADNMWDNGTNKSTGYIAYYVTSTSINNKNRNERGRPSIMAMANYFAPWSDSKYTSRAETYFDKGYTSTQKNILSGHASSYTAHYGNIFALRLNPVRHRKTYDYFRTFFAMSEVGDGQMITQPAREDSQSGGDPRLCGSALFALRLSEKEHSLHLLGAGGGNGEHWSNTPPVINGTPQTTVEADSNYSFTPTATDADDQTLMYSITNKPSWAGFNVYTGKLSGTATGTGTYSGIVISVSDGIDTDTLSSFSITVTAPPPPPNEAPEISGTPVSEIEAGTSYSFIPSASDPEDDTLTFSITGKPTWATFNASTGELAGTPDSGDAGAYQIVITVSDGSLTSGLNFELTVTYTPPPPPPTSEFILFANYAVDGELIHHSSRTGTQTINETSLTFDGKMNGEVQEQFTVTANTTLEFDFSSTSEGKAHWISVMGSTDYTFWVYGTKKPSSTSGVIELPEYPGTGTTHYSIKLSDYMPLGTYDGLNFKQLTDSMNSTWSDVKLHENEPNYPPVIEPIADDTFNANGSAYSFTPTVSDPEDDTLTYSVAGAPTWATFNTTTGEISGTPGSGDVAVSNITITVDDGANVVDMSYVLTVTYTPNYIDFTQYVVDGELPHHSSRTGTQTINGTSLTFDGKMNGEVQESFTVTANTVLEFDFSSTGEGKAHWLEVMGGSTFWIYGTKKPSTTSGVIELNEYSGTGTEHYSVKLSDYMPLGTYDGLNFKQLTDFMNSTWSNIHIHE
ncbi:MAG: DUF6288 domain-containing protein [Nitrosomonadaceae bacterium]